MQKALFALTLLLLSACVPIVIVSPTPHVIVVTATPDSPSNTPTITLTSEDATPTQEILATYSICQNASSHCNPINMNVPLNPNHDFTAGARVWTPESRTYAYKSCRQTRYVESPIPAYSWFFQATGLFCGDYFTGIVPEAAWDSGTRNQFNINISYLYGQFAITFPIYTQANMNYLMVMRHNLDASQLVGQGALYENVNEYCSFYVDNSTQVHFTEQPLEGLKTPSEMVIGFRTLSARTIEVHCGLHINYGVFDGTWKLGSIEWISVSDGENFRVIP